MIIVDSTKHNHDILMLLKKIKPVAVSHCSLHFSFSKLIDKYRSAYQVRIAVNTINDMLGEEAEGLIYIAKNLDVFVVFDTQHRDRVSNLVYQLKHLFSDDGLITDDSNIGSDFCTVYDLCLQWDAFFTHITTSVYSDNNIGKADSSLFNEQKSPITIASILQIESAIQNLNILHYTKTVTSYLVSENKIHPISDHLLIDYNKLLEHMELKVNIYSNPTLYKYINDSILKILLQELIDRSHHRRTINITLSVHVLMSHFFKDLCLHQLHNNKELSLIIDIEAPDALSNIQYMQEIFSFLEKHNIHHCIQYKHSPIIISPLDKSSFIKISANFDQFTHLPTLSEEQLSQLTHNRTIICDCDTEQKLQSFLNLGFVLFSGTYVTNLANDYSLKQYKKMKIQEK